MCDHRAILQHFLPHPHVEGLVPHYYCDIGGHVTYGVGHRVSRKEAEQMEMLADWQACRKAWRTQPDLIAATYGEVTAVRFDEDAIKTRLWMDVGETHRQCVALIPGYATAPAAFAMMTLELAFHIGTTRLRDTYPNFQDALVRRQLTRALSEIDRGAAFARRVAMVRGMILCMNGMYR